MLIAVNYWKFIYYKIRQKEFFYCFIIWGFDGIFAGKSQ